MRNFFRAFWLSFALGLLFFSGLAAIGVVATSLEESGFSSGALFRADFVGQTLFAELLGRDFALNGAKLPPPPKIPGGSFFLPPIFRLFWKAAVWG